MIKRLLVATGSKAGALDSTKQVRDWNSDRDEVGKNPSGSSGSARDHRANQRLIAIGYFG
jgi:hypothetical protein